MRTPLLLGALILTAVGCITEVRTIKPGLRIPGARVETGPEDTTEYKEERAREWIAELAEVKGSAEAQATRTIYLVRRLTESLPFSTGPLLEEGVPHESAKVRENSAFVLCYARDEKAEEALVGMLDDAEEAVRLSAAASLVTGYYNRSGVPSLLRALHSKSRHFRNEAIKNLRIFTQERVYYAYHADAPQAQREFSAAKWNDWWRRNGQTFQPSIRGPR